MELNLICVGIEETYIEDSGSTIGGQIRYNETSNDTALSVRLYQFYLLVKRAVRCTVFRNRGQSHIFTQNSNSFCYYLF
jgi:hypothetical protein